MSQFLRLFPKILSANDKYPILNRDKLTIAIQTQLYQKQKTFTGCFSEFLKCGLDIEYNGEKRWHSKNLHFPNYGL